MNHIWERYEKAKQQLKQTQKVDIQPSEAYIKNILEEMIICEYLILHFTAEDIRDKGIGENNPLRLSLEEPILNREEELVALLDKQQIQIYYEDLDTIREFLKIQLADKGIIYISPTASLNE